MTEIKCRRVSGLVRCILWLGIAWLAVPFDGQAADPNLHDLFETRCGSCHGHGGPFARQELVLVDGVLRGRESGREIASFLPGHFGKLSSSEAVALHDMFVDQIRSGGLFEAECRICHLRARDLAQDRLLVVDGVLYGRYSGRDIGAFLRIHGRLTDEEADRLTRILAEMAPGDP